MVKMSKLGKVSVVIGVIFAVIQLVFSDILYGPLSFIAPIISLWWLFIGLAAFSFLKNQYGFSVPTVQTGASIQRQNVIEPTNWVRESKAILRDSFGIAVALSAIVMFVISRALGQNTLSVLWLILTIFGAISVISAWRYNNSITTHNTENISIRVPDLFAVHSFHIALRQAAEDLGYQVHENTSPSQGGKSATHNEQIFHANGGFKAKKRPIEQSRILVDELSDDKYMSRIVTVVTLGVFSILLGMTILTVSDASLIAALTTNQIRLQITHVLGMMFLISGIIVTGYDYFTRTREWGELYCIEEGTIYSSSVNIYDEELLENKSRREPTVQTPETSAVLSITVGAKCTSLYDQSELEADFDELVEKINQNMKDHHFEVVERM